MLQKRSSVRWACVFVVGLCGACGYFGNWITEHRAPSLTAERFETIALLLGVTDQSSALFAEQVERRLADSGWTVIARPGRWRSEAEALQEICAGGPPVAVDGVLFVWPDRLQLRDCRTQLAAYEVRSERARTDELLNRLVRYLRGAPPLKGPAP